MFLNFALDIFWLLKQTYTFLKAFIFFIAEQLIVRCFHWAMTLGPKSGVTLLV